MCVYTYISSIPELSLILDHSLYLCLGLQVLSVRKMK